MLTIKFNRIDTREKLCDSIIYAAISLYLFVEIVLQGTLLPYKYNIGAFNFKLMLFFRAIILIVGMFRSKGYTRNNYISMAVFLAISFLSYKYSGMTTVFDLFFIVIFFPNIDCDKIAKIFYKTMIISVVITLLLYCFNVFPEYIIYRNMTDMQRYAFGFSHPNVLGRILMLICMLHVLIKKDESKILDVIGIVFVGIFVYVWPNSVTSAEIIFLLAAALLLSMAYTHFMNRNLSQSVIVKLGAKITLPIIFGAVVLITVNSDYQQIVRDFSITFYKRFYYGFVAIQEYGIHLFGNKITLVGSTQRYFSGNKQSTFVLDCLYILLLVRYGLVVTLYYLYEYIKGIANCIKDKNIYLLVVMVLIAVYSISENGMTVFYSSFIFICSLGMKRSKLKSDSSL